jgi:hypothetical protein
VTGRTVTHATASVLPARIQPTHPFTPDTPWNSLYIDAAVTALDAGGLTVSQEIRSRLSPLMHEHINFHGRYPIVRSHGADTLRALRDPAATEE